MVHVLVYLAGSRILNYGKHRIVVLLFVLKQLYDFRLSFAKRMGINFENERPTKSKAVSETTTSATATSRSARLPVLKNRQTRAI